VVEHFASADAVVPLKLFTLFTSDTRALGFVAAMRPKLDRVVRRVTGCDEWGVRVSLDKRRAYAGARKAAPRPAAGTPSGTSFLLRKKQEHDITRSLTARAAEQAREIYDELAAIARECQRRPPAGGPEVGPAVLLDAVFLVSSGQEKRFQAALRRATKQAAEHGLGVTLTGPWPPYHFAHVQTARAAS